MSKDNDFIFFKYPQKLTMLANAHPRKREMTIIFTPQRLRIGAWTSWNANQSSTGLDIMERQPYKEKKNYKKKEIQITTLKWPYFLKNKYLAWITPREWTKTMFIINDYNYNNMHTMLNKASCHGPNTKGRYHHAFDSQVS